MKNQPLCSKLIKANIFKIINLFIVVCVKFQTEAVFQLVYKMEVESEYQRDLVQ